MKKKKEVKKKKRRRFINAKMAEIIRTLHRKGGAMSAHEISKDTGISYVTVRKYLEIMGKKNIVWDSGKHSYVTVHVAKGKRPKRSKTRRYKLNYELIIGPDWNYKKKR